MIELRTLGAVNLLRDGHEMRALIAQPKRLALLCHLALAPHPGFRRRDSLLATFWPELNESQARAALRQALHVVRRTLGDDVVATRGSEELGTNRELVWCDAVAFETELDAGRLEQAMALYSGPLLDGVHLSGVPMFEEWLEDTRARLTVRACHAAATLAQRAQRSGTLEAAVRWARCAHELSPGDEGVFGAFLGLLVRAGDRCAAVNEYTRFARRLRRDYDMDPAPEIEAILRAARAPALSYPSAVVIPSSVASAVIR